MKSLYKKMSLGVLSAGLLLGGSLAQGVVVAHADSISLYNQQIQRVGIEEEIHKLMHDRLSI